jgi:hypothetical protein
MGSLFLGLKEAELSFSLTPGIRPIQVSLVTGQGAPTDPQGTEMPG